MTTTATKARGPAKKRAAALVVPDDELGELRMIPLESLIPAEDNIRDADELDPSNPEILALAISMKTAGVEVPLSVEPHPFEDGSFRIKAGGRRFVAAGVAHLDALPCIVKASGEAARQTIFVVENEQREGLGPIQLARGFKQMGDAGMTQREIADVAGISQPQVSKLLSLLKLPEHVQGAVSAGTMTQEDALSLTKLPAATVKELCADGDLPSDFEIRSAAYRVESERKVAASRKAAEEKGLTVVDESPDDWFQASFTSAGPDGTETVPEPSAVTVNGKWGTLGHVDPKEHESEPCHVVFIRQDGTTIPGCSNHEAHPKPEAEEDDEDGDDEAAVRTTARPANPAGVAAEQAMESLMPTIKKALAAGAPAEGVLSFAAVALLRDEDPWHTARHAGRLLELSGTTDDPLEDLCVLAEDDAATALTAFAVQSYASALQGLVYDVASTETPLEVMEDGGAGDDSRRSVADARRLLDFLRLVVPDDGIGTLEDIVSDFGELTDEEEVPDDTVGEDPTDGTGADAPTPSSTDAEDAQAGDGEGTETTTEFDEQMADLAQDDQGLPSAVTVSIEKGGKSGAPKFFRDCSECGRISGFNTNKGDAERRAREHIDEAHGGVGEVAEAA